MTDLEILKRHNLTEDNLKKWLAIDPLTVPKTPVAPSADSDQDKRHALINRIRSRVQEGLARNFKDFKTYHALDTAWDTPFRQISPTIMSTFLDQDPNSEEVYKKVQDWGLSNIIEEKTDPKSGKTIKSFNLPVFFQVMVPLVRAYVTIRWAKIMNDRMLTPFFSFEPVKLTTPLSLRCQVITDRVQVESQQYGNWDTMKQAVLKMLHYSLCLMFPKEEWHYEEQLKYADAEDVALGRKNESGEPCEEGDEITVTTREGLRYHLPHPTRTYRDLAHGAHTFNYDSGCEYAGYWRIARYREVSSPSSNFWNQDKIALGNVDLISGNRLFFTTVYSACTLTIPVAPSTKAPEGPVAAAQIGLGPGDLDREKELASLYYGTEHGDQGVFVTEHFEKLIPADNGLGTYPYPVWFRFVLAGDQCTILYAAPLPYAPVIYFGYDADESRTQNASLSLEVLPFQDHFSNVLTQILLSAKQNLANLTFIDEDQVEAATAKKLTNIGEGYYRFLNIMGYSGKKAFRGQTRIADAVQVANLPKVNVAEMIAVLKNILDVLERVLVMSSQEVAQAASHELRVDEVRNIQQSTSSRLVFTAAPVDIAGDAWKRQLYQGLMAYGDENFYAHLPSEIPLDEKALTEMGFTFIEAGHHTPSDRFRRVRILKSKTAIPIHEIASTRDAGDRADKTKIAQVMGLILQNMLNNPMLAQAIGPDQAIDLCNLLWKFAGLPPDKKLRNVAPAGTPQEQQAQAQAQLKQVVDIVLQQVNSQLQQELKPLLDETSKQGNEIAMIFRALGVNVPSPNGAPNGQPNGNSNPGPAAPGGPAPADSGMAAPAGLPPVPGLLGQPRG